MVLVNEQQNFSQNNSPASFLVVCCVCMTGQMRSQICTDNITAYEFARTHGSVADNEKVHVVIVILNDRKGNRTT